MTEYLKPYAEKQAARVKSRIFSGVYDGCGDFEDYASADMANDFEPFFRCPIVLRFDLLDMMVIASDSMKNQIFEHGEPFARLIYDHDVDALNRLVKRAAMDIVRDELMDAYEERMKFVNAWRELEDENLALLEG